MADTVPGSKQTTPYPPTAAQVKRGGAGTGTHPAGPARKEAPHPRPARNAPRGGQHSKAESEVVAGIIPDGVPVVSRASGTSPAGHRPRAVQV